MTIEVALTGGSQSPREARHSVAEELERRGFPARAIEDAVLLVSELVTNAIMHGDGEMQLRCGVDGDVARIGVSDGDPRPPLLRERDVTAIGGRGMQLVDMLAARWGVERGPTGKTVWFEVTR